MLARQDISLVLEGMEVFDRDNVVIGVVKAFLPGAGPMGTISTDIDTMTRDVSNVLNHTRSLPISLCIRLFEEGFVYVNRGVLGRDVILFPIQIEYITSYSIFLNVCEVDLLKL